MSGLDPRMEQQGQFPLMKMKSYLTIMTVIALAFALGACSSTPDSRIKRNQALFDTFTPEDQAKIRQGIVGIGFTPDMVSIAMGTADEVRTRTTAQGGQTIWVYNRWFRDYVGHQHLGYRRDVYFDPRVQAWRVFYTPVSAAVYQDRVEEVGRVVFMNGKVVSVEVVQ